MISLPHNHETNLFTSIYRRATVSIFSSKINSVIEADRALLHWGRTSLPFHHARLINFISQVIERPQGLRLSTQRFSSSSPSCFKHFVMIKFSKFYWQMTNDIVTVDLLAGSWICTWNKLINSKKISPLTLFFKNYFLILKQNSKAATGVVL